MSREVQGMLIQIEATTAQLRRELQEADRAVSRTSKRIDQELSAIDSAFDRTAQQVMRAGSLIKGALGGITAIAAGRAFLTLSGQIDDTRAQLELLTGSASEADRAFDLLVEVSKQTKTSIGAVSDSFIGAARDLLQMGYSTEEAVDYTHALNAALDASAIKGQRAESVTYALSKAMGSGKLSGQELNTVLASGGRIAEVIADELGVTTSQLREMGAAGQITSDVIANGLIKNLDILQKEASTGALTAADGMTRLSNAVTLAADKLNQATGAGEAFAGLLIKLEGAIESIPWDAVGTAATVLASVIAARLTAAVAASAVQFGKGAIEAARYQTALAQMAGVSRSAAAGIGIMTTATRGLGSALSLVGGPAGLALLAAQGLYHFITRTTEAEKEAAALERRLAGLTESFDNLSKSQAALTRQDYEKALIDQEEAAAAAANEVESLQKTISGLIGVNDQKRLKEWEDKLLSAQSRLDTAKGEVERYRDAIEELTGIINRNTLSVRENNQAQREMGEAAEEYLSGLQKRMDQLWAGNSNLKKTLLHIREHGKYTEQEAQALIKAAQAADTYEESLKNATSTTRTSTVATRSHTQAIDSLIAKYDPAVRAQADYEKGIKAADKAYEKGEISLKQYQKVIQGLWKDLNQPAWDKHNKKADEAREKIQRLDDQVQALRDRFEPLNVPGKIRPPPLPVKHGSRPHLLALSMNT